MTDQERAAKNFVLQAICEWGQSEEKRIGAVQAVLDAARFDAKATCWPVFGGIWPKACEGPEKDAATAWLHDLTLTMRRGKFEEEVAHVLSRIQRRNVDLEASNVQLD